MTRFSRTEDMIKLLNDCKSLSEYVKNTIIAACHGTSGIPASIRDNSTTKEIGRSGTYLLFLKGYLKKEEKVNDVMIPELIKCLDLFDDYVVRIGLHHHDVSSKGFEMLLESFIKRDAKYEGIYLENNIVGDACIDAIGKYIQLNKFIKEISFGVGVSDKGIERLLPYMEGNIVLKKIDLRGNSGITDVSIPLLLKIIETSNIVNASIENTSIYQSNVLNASLIHNKVKFEPTSLILNRWDIKDEDLSRICDYMRKYSIEKWKEIFLSRNLITSKGASILFNTLSANHALISSIVILGNQIDDDCMASLGGFIQSSQHICVVNISQNRISDKGIEELILYLEGNIILEQLILDGNQGITNASIPLFLDVANTSSIKNISTIDTSIATSNRKDLDECLSIPIEQRQIPIKSKTKSAAKVSASS